MISFMSLNNRQTKCMVIEIRRAVFFLGGEYGINSKVIREPSALEMFYILIWVAVTLVCVLYVCVCARVYLVVNLKFVCFTILYLNKRINTSLKPQRKKVHFWQSANINNKLKFPAIPLSRTKKWQSDTQYHKAV